MTTGEPLSDARLAEIKVWATQSPSSTGVGYAQAAVLAVELIDEVERLRAREAALLSLSNAALDNSKRHEAEMHTVLMRILDDADTFGWTSDAVSAARRRTSAGEE